MKYKLLFLAVLFTSNMLFSQSVVVNKYRNVNNTTADIIELLVVQDNADLRNLIVKSFSNNNLNDSGGSISFNNISFWSSMKAGTIIVITITSTAAADIATSCTDFNLNIGASNAAYFTVNTGTFNLANNDMCMIKTGLTTGVANNIHTLLAGSSGTTTQWFAIGSGTRVGTSLLSTGTTTDIIYVTNASSTIGDYNLGTTAGAATIGGSSTMSFGVGNNVANTNFINFLRGPVSTPASSVSIGSFSANWGAVTGATSYFLDVSTVPAFGSFVTGYNNLNVGNVVTYPVTGLSPGTQYYYRVRAINATPTTSGNSCTQTLTTLNGKVSASSGDWNVAATWNPVGVPAAGENVLIQTGHVVYTASTVTRTGTTTVDGTFQLDTGGWSTGTAFSYNATTGGLNFNNTTAYTVNNVDTFWPTTLPPFNVNVLQGGLTMNMASRTVGGTFLTASGVTLTGSTLTLNGTCQINTGGFFNNSPTYGNASTLIYNDTAPYVVGSEWTGNSTTAGTGIPQNVTIQNGTSLNMPNSDRGLAGNLNINSGNLTLNATSGDLYVAGNWTRVSATFTPNARSVYFNAPTAVNQIVTVSATGTETFNYLRVLGIGTLKLATGTNVVVNAFSGLTLGSTNATSTIDLSGQTLTLSGGGNLDLSAGAKKITSTLAGGKVIITTADLTVTNGGSLTTDTNITVDLQRGLDCGTASLVTINGILQINTNGFCIGNSPRYGATSLLHYNSASTYNRQMEWTSTTAVTGGVGAPNNVQVSNNTLLNYYNAGNNGAKSIVGNLVVDAGSTLDMLLGGASTVGALTIPGNVTVAGTLKLGFALGDDLKIGGNLAFTGTGSLVGNNRAVFFTKTGTQTVSSVAALTIPFVVTAGTGTTVQLLSSLIISSSASGTNVVTFGNAADVIDINGQTLTLGTDLFSGVISGTGSFKGSTTSNLTLKGTGNIGTVKLVTDLNLGTFVMNRTATGGCTMGSAVTVNTALTLTAGLIDLNNTIMTLAVGVNPTGSATSYIIADVSALGILRKNISAVGPQTFPISSGGTQYTPATITFAAGNTFAGGAYVGMAVENNKEPNLDATANYINRYWEVTSAGITLTTYNFVGTFINSPFPGGDVTGTAGTSRANQWNGTAWLNNGGAGSVTTTITAPASSLPAINHFTGGLRDPEIHIRTNVANVPYLSGSTYNFGTVTIGTPVTATFQIQNLGQQNLAVKDKTMSGSANYATNYAYTTASPLILSALNNQISPWTTITFTPSTSGTITGSISIVNTDTSGSEDPYVINFTGVGNCPAATATATPTSGPEGTDVLINASVGNFTGTTSVNFNGVLAAFVLNSTTQIKVTVPTSAVSGSINIVNASNCVTTTPFTVISKTGTCSGMNELIMTEIYDLTAGSLGYIEVYNGTGATINLSTYKIRRYADNAALIANNYIDFAFTIPTIASGAVKYGKISNDLDTATPDFTYTPSAFVGINGSDIFYLYNGTTVVDVFAVPTSGFGYTERRKLTTTGPNTSSNPSDWTEIVSPGESIADLGLFPYTPPANNVPAINTDPVDLTTCNLTASFSVSATPTAGSLTYQWQYNSGLTAGWSPIAGGTFTGVTATGFASNTLTLNGTIGTLTGYQFYCQVTQTGGCTVASDAAQLTVSSATWNGTSWTNGPPSLTKQVILTGSYNMAALLPSFEACSLYVNSPNVLTITSGNYVSVLNNITVVSTGNIIVNDDASLVQIANTGVNTGSVTVERVTSAKIEDYVYWSSPVANFPVTSISPTTSTSLIWKWNPTANNSNNGQGRWEHPVFTPTPDNMAVGVGYIIKGLAGTNNTTFTDYLATFPGTPFNGIKQPSIARGDITTVAGIFPAAPYNGTNGTQITQNSDNMNLIGNPYPSAVKAIDFLNLNTNIDGNVRLWTHGTAPNTTSSPYYGTYGYNYSVGDYITYNVSGTSTGPSAFSGYIASGQGFFVTMNDGAADATQTVTFNNAMRSLYNVPSGTYTYFNNSNFYRNANSKAFIPQDLERHRIWLELINADATISTRMLVGYIEGATMEKDRLFDASTTVGNSQNLYSLIADKPFCIQGRTLPFDSEDAVPLGVKLPTPATYTIAIATTDGLFHETNQGIYLEDTALQIIHDLRQAPYVFTAESGRFDTRFILRYKNTVALGTNNFETLQNSVVVATPNHNQIAIKSYIENMKSVVVYDILGRVVYDNSHVNAKEMSILNGVLNQQALIVKITLENGLVVTKKIVL